MVLRFEVRSSASMGDCGRGLNSFIRQLSETGGCRSCHQVVLILKGPFLAAKW